MYDVLSVCLIECVGFFVVFMLGFCVFVLRLVLLDIGLILYGEMVDVGCTCNDATSVSFLIVGDGDDGYGNVMNVKCMVCGYVKVGFVGILIED